MNKKLAIFGLILSILFPQGSMAKTVKQATLIGPKGNQVVVIAGTPVAKSYFGVGYHVYKSGMLGAVVNQAPSLFETSLASAINTTATAMTLVTGKDRSGTSLSGNICFTLDSGLTTTEFVCGVASGTSITNLIRGIKPDGVSTSSSLAYSHRYGSDVKVTDFPVLQQYGRIINGQDTFPNKLTYDPTISITVGDSSTTIVNKDYVDKTSIAGAANSSETVNGIGQIATRNQASLGTATGSTGARLFLPASMSASSSVSTTTIPVTNSSGQIDSSFLSGTSTNYTLNTNFSLNGTTTINGLLIGKNVFPYIASTTINGKTTPVPVYIATSTGSVLPVSSLTASTSAYKFIGFAVTNAVNGGTVYVQTSGQVSGFSGLTPGSIYYASTSSGLISTSEGNISIKVGYAISSTTLTIQRERLVWSLSTSINISTTTTYVIGFRPSKITIQSIASPNSSGQFAGSFGGYSINGGNSCIYQANNGGGSNAYGTAANAYYSFNVSTLANGNSGIIQNLTDYGFQIANTLTGSGVVSYLFITAEE